MKKDGLAVEGEGDLVQRRQVSPIIVVPSQTQKRWGWMELGGPNPIVAAFLCMCVPGLARIDYY